MALLSDEPTEISFLRTQLAQAETVPGVFGDRLRQKYQRELNHALYGGPRLVWSNEEKRMSNYEGDTSDVI